MSRPESRHPAPMLLVLALRWLAFGWMLVLVLISGQVQEPAVATAALLGTAGWSAWLTLAAVRRMPVVLAVDLGVAVALILLSGYMYPPHVMLTNHPSFAGAYPAVAVAACGVVYGIRGGAAAGLLLGGSLPFAYAINGAYPATLSYLQLLTLIGWALSYVLLGGTIGVAAGQLDRLRTQVTRIGQRAARMAERQRIAARIHDDVLQQLGQLQARIRELAAGRPALDAVAEDVARQEAALRGLALAEPDVGPPGRSSLREQLETVAAQLHELPVRLIASGPAWLPNETVEEVVAAVRELLTNVVKHARAHRVWLTVLEDGGHITVSVRDDGMGFVPGRETDTRLGLRLSVRARVERLGGRIRIRSRPGEGTEVELLLPVR